MSLQNLKPAHVKQESMSKFGEMDFLGAIFVCHPSADDGRTHGPFWLVEEALQTARLNSMVYKNSLFTQQEKCLIACNAPLCKWINKTYFIPNPDPKTSRARVSKLQALARLGRAGAYQAAFHVAMIPSNEGSRREKPTGI